MSELTDDDLLAGLRAHWTTRDPVPDDLVARLQAAAALAASDTDLDIELMALVERSDELVGARGGPGPAYTLRFAHDGVDLLLRVSSDEAGARIDGWIVPPSPLTIRVLRDESVVTSLEIGDTGRFELTGQASGILRLRLEPTDGTTAFLTPAFEI